MILLLGIVFVLVAFMYLQRETYYSFDKKFNLPLTDASGLTYSRSRNTYLIIDNGSPQIIEMELSGKVIRTIILDGFSDTEAICWIKGDLYAVCEERNGRVLFIYLPPDLKTIKYKDIKFRHNLKVTGSKPNKGVEGMCYDKKSNIIYCVCTYSEKPIILLIKNSIFL